MIDGLLAADEGMTSRRRACRAIAAGVCLLCALCRPAAAQSGSDERNERLNFLIKSVATGQAFLAGSYPESTVPRLLRFSNGKRIGFLDLNGTIVVPPMFDDADIFLDGRLRISLNKKRGFIDAAGRIAIEPKYDDLALVWSFPMPAKMEDRWGLIDEKGEWILKPTYERLRVEGGLLVVRTNGKWGLTNPDGTTRIAPVYDDIYLYRNACAVRTGRKWGLIDLAGKTILEHEYDRLSALAEGYALVSRNGRSAIISVRRNAVPLFEHDQIYPTENRQRWIVKDGNRYGVVDRRGREIIKQQYARIGTNGKDRFNVTLAGLTALADVDGRYLTRFIFEDIGYFQRGLAAVRLGGKWGYIDMSGKMVIEARFDYAESFDDDLAVVSLKGKRGYIDKKGTMIIEPQFEDAFPFLRDGIAVLKSEGRYSYVDRSLRRIADWIQLDVPTQEDFSLAR